MSRRWKLVAAGLVAVLLVVVVAVALGVHPHQCLITRSMGTTVEVTKWFDDCQ